MINGWMTSVLAEFAQRCSISGLAFDRDNCCRLIVDHGIALTVNVSIDRLTIVGLVSDRKPALDWHTQLMKNAIVNGDPAVYWDEDLGLVGFVHVDQHLLTASLLEQLMVDFIDWIKTVTSRPQHFINPVNQALDIDSSLGSLIRV